MPDDYFEPFAGNDLHNTAVEAESGDETQITVENSDRGNITAENIICKQVLTKLVETQ